MGPWLRSHGRLPRGCSRTGSRSSFNGAVASQPRKASRTASGAAPRCRASMGPWLRSHGRGDCDDMDDAQQRSFNGAVASQPRKDLAPAGGGSDARGFNGAVASQPRKGRVRLLGHTNQRWASMGPWLRSHGRVSVGSSSVSPSMLQWGRGFAATEGCPDHPGDTCPRCFNGAVASQPRKDERDGSSAGLRPALQWGRGFAATEGPWFWSTPSPRRDASMGPWLRSHGREEIVEHLRGAAASFNGAVASQPRKGTNEPGHYWASASFNGAVASQPRKDLLHRHRDCFESASMGPWLRSHGREGMARHLVDCGLGFNGAVASQPRKGLLRGNDVDD